MQQKKSYISYPPHRVNPVKSSKAYFKENALKCGSLNVCGLKGKVQYPGCSLFSGVTELKLSLIISF